MLKRSRVQSNRLLAPQPLVNADSPWEQLEFVTIGSGIQKARSPTTSQVSFLNPVTSAINGGFLITSTPPSRPHSPVAAEHVSDVIDRSRSYSTERKLSVASSVPFETPNSLSNSEHQSSSEILVTPELLFENEQADLIAHQKLNPVLSIGKSDFDPLDTDLEHGFLADQRKASGPTLMEFFQEHGASTIEEAPRIEGGGTSSVQGKLGFQMSAAAYFNRQASLLMLYFPLAVSISCRYLAVG